MRGEESSNSCTKTAENTWEKFKYSRIAALSYNMSIKNHATRNALSAFNTYCANTIFRVSSKKEKNLSHDLTPKYSSSFWFLHCDYLENKVTCFNNLTRTQLERNPKIIQWPIQALETTMPTASHVQALSSEAEKKRQPSIDGMPA